MSALIDPARLAALRLSLNTSSKDSESERMEFPLWALLVIYHKANRACYVNYMEGLKNLVEWLKPISITPKNPSYYSSRVLGGYETSRLADILNTDYNIILECVVTEVLPRLEAFYADSTVTNNDRINSNV